MADPLVETKLLRPRPRREVVQRPRLADLLRRASDSPVTLVSAPAGFGKTTLLASWLSADRDGGDEHPLHGCPWTSGTGRPRRSGPTCCSPSTEPCPGTGAAALTLHQSGQAQVETVLAGIVNELSVHSGEVTVVLDDYHLADGVDVATGMTFLVDHLPPQLRLVIGTRADPALPLSRLRARGELVEIRAADLRFTGEEVATYLNGLNGFDLTSVDIAALETRTEGWVAALQLAAISLRDRDDRSAFIAGFAGDDRFVVDYLADEVLARQPDNVRRFLLDTSILDRLTGPLCEAVSPLTSGTSGKAMLEALDHDNLFLVPLDGHRRWYRYHHLFGDVLHAHLLEERPDDVPELHRRAAGWYADAGADRGRRSPFARRWRRGTGSRSRRADVPGAGPRAARGPRPPLGVRNARRSSRRPSGARDRTHRRADVEQRLRGRGPTSRPRRGTAGEAGGGARGRGPRRTCPGPRLRRDVPGGTRPHGRRPGRCHRARTAGHRGSSR